MEGLIPMLYTAVKKQRSHSRYTRLSPSTAPPTHLFPEADSYYDSQISSMYQTSSAFPRRNGHNRSMSMGACNLAFSPENRKRSMGGSDVAPPTPKKLSRFRSQRMFSCLSGV